ncbi:MAG: alpha-ribazole phosphatase [Thermoanaerobacteraceae bacterium]|jgi:alpha-ribazole phosphatase/probable phosphoglycerate mutase|nr:alpha-ribazole phosphatase [Thermoanaerobacteraceae bacterium]
MGCRIYLVRHGETLWNHALKYQGHADIALSERGVRQAEALARRLSSERFAAFYASDLSRALDTARIIARPHGGTVEVVSDLREINFGEWEGLTRDEIKNRFPEVSRQWWTAPYTTRLPGGESLCEVATRAVRALQQIAANHADEQVLVVSHGGTIRAAIGSLLRMDLNQYWRLRQDNAALNVLELFEEGKAILMLFNDCAHLRDI